MNIRASIKASALLLAWLTSIPGWAFDPSQQPADTTAVPGNVMLALSVEFPTGLQVSYTTENYNSLLRYDGYFDNRKCYTYSTSSEVFDPTNAISTTGTCANAEWNGNLLNWLTMTNIDQFRSVMTGGTRDNFSSMNLLHAGDTTARTVLIRSFSDRNSYNPIKRIRTTDPIPSALRSTTARYVRSGGYGSKFIVSTSNNFADLSDTNQRVTCGATPLPTGGTCFNIRVSACVLSAAQGVIGNTREANCQARYSGVAKPEGLIQEYAGTLRFGAFGYLNQTGNDRNGGVLRAAMKSVGPVAATSAGTTVPNLNVEWDTTTGVIFANPDPVDALASLVTNSGLMNYLNKFGYAAGYKGNDPVSELYYAAQRYMRGLAQPSSYTNNLTDAYKDGFPVITGTAHQRGGLRDPIIATCQKNFVLGIGDIYTHQDGDVPADETLNIASLRTRLFAQEGMAENAWIGGSSGGTANIAAFAHWGNTNDIRPDLAGTQNIRTYWVDVLENGNGVGGMPAAGTLRTQYWLAAKYGGFDTSMTPADNPNARINATDPLSWDKNGDGVPDTWFAGSTPTLLKSSLSTAFSSIASEAGAGSASSAAVTSSRQTSSSQVIYAGYNPQNWSGTVRACSPTQTAAQCDNNPAWEASRWFKTSTPTLVTTPLTPNTRKIITSWRTATAFTRMAFRWGAGGLNADQQTILNASDLRGSDRLSYLRGDRTNEATAFRARGPNLLGDIVNSGVTYLEGSGPALLGSRFPGHVAYRVATRNRPAVVYVGGNDGMLHAFSGAPGASAGKELFAYIPSSVFSALPSLSALNFRHRYFVDSTPMVGDFEKTPANWGTLLVGGLGAGGRGYYALDISNQSTFETTGEADLASTLPLWEFTSAQDTDLGYTFNEASMDPLTGAYRQIAKVADSTVANGVWRVVVGNGFGSTLNRAVLFLIDANTGTVRSTDKLIAAPAVIGTDNGLATPTPVDTDGDGLVDTIYAGDALGNMHKFQFSRPSGVDFVRAASGDAQGQWRYLGRVYSTGEPITTAPSVAPACDGVGWNVAFGTGKLNEDDDYDDNSTRGFYNVVDRSPSSALTVSSAQLATITYSAGVTRTWTTPNLTNRRGWRMSFSDGERVLSNSTLPPDTGTVLLATTKPAGDICTPGNTGFVMAVNLCSGRIGDLIVNGNVVGGAAISSTGVIKVSNSYADYNNRQTVVCNQADCKAGGMSGGGPSGIPGGSACDDPTTAAVEPCNCDDPTTAGVVEECAMSQARISAPRGRYSWREILTK